MKHVLFLLARTLCALLISCVEINNASSKENAETKNVRFKVGKAPGSVEVGDFNNDKLPDLAVANEADSSVTILLNDGKGKFNEVKGSPFFAGRAPNDIAIGDFNRDGNADLAFANHEHKYVTVLLGRGNGSFAPAGRSPIPTQGLPHPHGIAIGDFNGDKQPDLVTDSWGDDQVEILFGDTSKVFASPGTFFKVGRHPYQRLRVADINGDGIDDIITTNLDGNSVTVLLCDGKGNFNAAKGSPFPCGNAPFGVAIGDVNADGKIDLAIINSPASTGGNSVGINGMTVLLGDGTGSFTMMKGSPFEAGKIPNRIAIGDVNNDGVSDIVTSDNDNNKIYVFLMSKQGSVASRSSMTVGNHPKGIAIADLNGDGKGDIVVCNNADNDISIIMSK